MPWIEFGQTHRIRLGYRVDARPFSYQNESGRAAGYSVALCEKVVAATKRDLSNAELTVDWVPLSLGERFQALQLAQVDLLCGADTVTLARRQDVSFSIPIFPGGVGALTRADAPARLREVLSGQGQSYRPSWRATAGTVLQARAFSAVKGTTAEKWLRDSMTRLNVVAEVGPVSDYDTGVRTLLERKSDVLFGERAILADAIRRSPSGRDLAMIDRSFTYEPLALALAKNDDDFRLLVDQALSRLYRSGELAGLYTSAFGEPDESATTFFRWNALAELTEPDTDNDSAKHQALVLARACRRR